MKITSINPPFYIFGLLIFMIGLDHFIPIYRLIPSPYNTTGGIVVIVGLVLNLWADSIFRKHKTTVKPHQKPQRFIQYGPFEVSRHPMYLGFVFLLIGVAIVQGSITPFIGPVILFFILDHYFIPLEEANMLEQFGEVYRDYQLQVSKWFHL